MAMLLPVAASRALIPVSATAIFMPTPVPAAGSGALPVYQA